MEPFEVDRQTELIRKQIEQDFFDFCECCKKQYNCPKDMYFDPRDGCDEFAHE